MGGSNATAHTLDLFYSIFYQTREVAGQSALSGTRPCSFYYSGLPFCTSGATAAGPQLLPNLTETPDKQPTGPLKNIPKKNGAEKNKTYGIQFLITLHKGLYDI